MSHPEEPTRDQLARLEARLSAIEDRLEMRAPTASRARRVPPAPPRAAAPAPPAAARTTTPPTPAGGWSISVTGIMASGAGVAFVLAAVYFLKLVYDFGWLTPELQVANGVRAHCRHASRMSCSVVVMEPPIAARRGTPADG